MPINYEPVARQAAINAGYDPDMFVRQMMAESGLQVGRSSSAGAQGIAQIMPATARAWGVDPNNPVAALNAAAKAMAKYYRSYGGDYAKALAAYNAGTGAVNQWGGVPPYAETKAYIAKIMGVTTPDPSNPRQATQSAQPAYSYNPTAVSNQANRIMNAYGAAGASDIGQGKVSSLYEKVNGSLASPAGVSAPNMAGGATGPVPPRKPGETGQQYLDRVLMARFGLRHDAGNSQTTGGSHMRGSDHYINKATDFGNGLNSPAKLQAAEDWVEANAAELGAKPVIYGGDEDANHADHAHFATKYSANKNKNPIRINPITPPPTFTRPARNKRPVKSKRLAR